MIVYIAVYINCTFKGIQNPKKWQFYYYLLTLMSFFSGKIKSGKYSTEERKSYKFVTT